MSTRTNRLDVSLSNLPLTPPTGTDIFPWADTKSVLTITDGPQLKVEVDGDALSERLKRTIADARAVLWDPTEAKGRGVFAIGMEGGQYGEPLPELLMFGKEIGCQAIQPSANHIDLARCATDAQYRAWVRAVFIKNELPLLTVSVHVIFYALFACIYNPLADQFIPPDCKGATREETQQKIVRKIMLMMCGAAELGIEVLHLFFGKAAGLAEYLWPPHGETDLVAAEDKFVAVMKPLIELARRLKLKFAHEVHFGTVACNSRDFIRVWLKLDAPDVVGIGEDPSHRWHGSPWHMEMIALAEAGVQTFIAHAKNTVLQAGLGQLGHTPNHLLRGVHFGPLSAPSGIVDMELYLGHLAQTSTLVNFWVERGLPAQVHVEAEYPGRRIDAVTERGVQHLLNLIGPRGWHRVKGDFTDAMKAK